MAHSYRIHLHIFNKYKDRETDISSLNCFGSSNIDDYEYILDIFEKQTVQNT